MSFWCRVNSCKANYRQRSADIYYITNKSIRTAVTGSVYETAQWRDNNNNNNNNNNNDNNKGEEQTERSKERKKTKRMKRVEV
jgi:hypothetical protein